MLNKRKIIAYLKHKIMKQWSGNYSAEEKDCCQGFTTIADGGIPPFGQYDRGMMSRI